MKLRDQDNQQEGILQVVDILPGVDSLLEDTLQEDSQLADNPVGDIHNLDGEGGMPEEDMTHVMEGSVLQHIQLDARTAPCRLIHCHDCCFHLPLFTLLQIHSAGHQNLHN